jgi:hypothetical protein
MPTSNDKQIVSFILDQARELLRSGVPAEQVPARMMEIFDPQRTATELTHAAALEYSYTVVEQILGITLARDPAQTARVETLKSKIDDAIDDAMKG